MVNECGELSDWLRDYYFQHLHCEIFSIFVVKFALMVKSNLFLVCTIYFSLLCENGAWMKL